MKIIFPNESEAMVMVAEKSKKNSCLYAFSIITLYCLYHLHTLIIIFLHLEDKFKR